jgi:hypothetical protein
LCLFAASEQAATLRRRCSAVAEFDYIPVGSNPLATNRWVRDGFGRVTREYLEHPCAVPGCPCMTHRLGLPTLAELVAAGYFAAHCENRDR